jgi:hypothetical protein
MSGQIYVSHDFSGSLVAQIDGVGLSRAYSVGGSGNVIGTGGIPGTYYQTTTTSGGVIYPIPVVVIPDGRIVKMEYSIAWVAYGTGVYGDIGVHNYNGTACLVLVRPDGARFILT